MNCQTIEEKEQPIIYLFLSSSTPPQQKPTKKISILQPKRRHAMDRQGCFFGTFQAAQCLYRPSSSGIARQLASAIHPDTRGRWRAPVVPNVVRHVPKWNPAFKWRYPGFFLSTQRTPTIKNRVKKLKNNFMKGEWWLNASSTLHSLIFFE